MQCIHCLSREAKPVKGSVLELVFTPLVMPFYCVRCMTRFYVPSLVVLSRRLFRHSV